MTVFCKSLNFNFETLIPLWPLIKQTSMEYFYKKSWQFIAVNFYRKKYCRYEIESYINLFYSFIICRDRKGPMGFGLSILLPVRKFSWNLLVFQIFGMVLMVHVWLCVTDPGFLRKIPFWQKWSKVVKNGQQMGYFNYFEKFCHYFLIEAFINENWYRFLSCTVLIPEKIFFVCLFIYLFIYLFIFLFILYLKLTMKTDTIKQMKVSQN